MNEQATPAQQLKASTLDAHRATERLLDVGSLLRGPYAPEHYRRILRTMHHAWSGLADVTTTTDWWPPYARLAGELAAAAAADLSELNATTGPVPQAYPGPDDEVALCGAAYVQFGSLLGGTMIHRALLAAPGFPTNALSFYGLCARYGGRQWGSLVTILNEKLVGVTDQPAANSPQQIAERQANRTFAHYAALFRQT